MRNGPSRRLIAYATADLRSTSPISSHAADKAALIVSGFIPLVAR